MSRRCFQTRRPNPLTRLTGDCGIATLCRRATEGCDLVVFIPRNGAYFITPGYSWLVLAAAKAFWWAWSGGEVRFHLTWGRIISFLMR